MIIGHIKQQHYFRQLIAAQQLSHAYILSGTEGIGKKLFAKELGIGLLCPEHRLFTQCDCPSCIQIAAGSHPDFHLFETNEDLKIENIRAITELSAMSTYSGGWKVFILDNAHILSNAGADAANALLKTLEEPSENTVFLLITHKLNKILPTIRSRCINIAFDPLNDADLRTIFMNLSIDANDTLEFAAGSVSQAMLLHDINIAILKKALEQNDLTEIGKIIFSVGDKTRLIGIVAILFQYYIACYKQSSNSNLLPLIRYLEETMNNLDYNLNFSLISIDIYTKISEALR